MTFRFVFSRLAVFCVLAVFAVVQPQSAHAQGVPANVQQQLAALQKSDPDIVAFYAARKFKPMFVGNGNNQRRTALINALKGAGAHGLPVAAYDPAGLDKMLRGSRKAKDRAAAEIKAAKTLVTYVRHMTTGVVQPSAVDREIAIFPKQYDATSILDAYSKSTPRALLAKFVPNNPEYAALMAEKRRLTNKMGGATVADVPLATLRPGVSAQNVTTMRAKLSALGYGNLGNSPKFDGKLVEVVKKFQADRGLGADGIVGPATINAMNFGPKSQMIKVLVNLERQRWLNFERGGRHIVVNIPDYSVAVWDNGKVSHKTRVVVGQNKKDFRTPEFYDQMSHLVVNPTWNVPKSIAVKEYVPIIRRDPGFLRKRGMYMVNGSGKRINPSSVNLASYNANNFKTFPYFIKQKPDPRNALGLVKFMFPNKFNIYLHDTPSKKLFARETRTFSHGCVRVQNPFDLAYKLLEKQLQNPKGTFAGWLNTGKEQYVNLKTPVPIYITYRTVYFDGGQNPVYRPDTYGRDKKLFSALQKAGVALTAAAS